MQLYLTPAGLSYLTQLIFAALISGYLLLSLRRSSRRHTLLLAGFFLALSGFIAALLFSVLLAPGQRLYAVFVQNPLLGAALICAIQFAYHFPAFARARRYEAWAALILSGLYTLWECGYAVSRFIQLDAGQVYFRPSWADYALLLLLLWVPVGFLRQLYALAPARDGGWRRWAAPLLRPATSEARAIRVFVAVTLFAAGLSAYSTGSDAARYTAALASIVVSLGMLIALFSFTVSYLNAQPGTTSFMIKLVGLTLTAVLATLGVVGWVVTPYNVARHQIDLPDQQTLRFTPNPAGGYDVAAAPYRFDPARGQRLDLTSSAQHSCSDGLDFPFRFFGRDYAQLYACNDGTVSFGQMAPARNYQYRYGAATPLIMAMLIDLSPDSAPGGVFARYDADRVIITWDRMRGVARPDVVLTFQATLYRSGTFDLSYGDMPEQIAYFPNEEPTASVWAVGAVPGRLDGAGPQQLALAGPPLRVGPEGGVHDYMLEYRRRLHEDLAPLAWLILAASASVITIFPLLFYVNLVKPLTALLQGVQRMEAGAYTLSLPVRYPDEVGFLTRAFNRLSAELGNLIQTLESRVAGRTADLDAANARLRAEIAEREEAQAQMLHYQRTLAALGERERLGRELHDSLGQMFGFINLQVQAAQTLLRNGENTAALSAFHLVAEAARHSHDDVRGFILGLRATSAQNFWAALQRAVDDLRASTAMEITIQAAEPWDDSWLSPIGELNLLRIIQEALVNARRHAHATHVRIMIERHGDQLWLTVRDNGQGFRPEQGQEPSEAGHFGLRTMHERMDELGGELTISSDPIWGTEIRIVCPIRMPPDAARPPAGPLRVVLVDDHPMFLEGLRSLLAAHGMQVVGVGRDGEEAQSLARTLRPDLIVMDLQMPRCDGLEATRRIKAEWPEARIVILTVAAEEDLLFEALKAGAAGYLLKNMHADDFFLLLANLDQGAPMIAPELATRIDLEMTRYAAAGVAVESALSPQQREILALISRGLTYREVASQVHLSEAAIKYHMKQILANLHLANRAQAVAYAHRSGLVSADS
ncbi:MAG: hybrid sensor histidine kinase/response regulator transcription factor [Chloroflexales bacterium]